MKTRLHAILIHGLGNRNDWWTRFIPLFERCGINPVLPDLPDLEKNGPEEWVKKVCTLVPGDPCILIGHSLGAAVALETARMKHFEGVYLLSIPLSSGPVPPLPKETDLSVTALARIGCFLKNTTAKPAPECIEYVHFIGDDDPYVDKTVAASLPYPVFLINDTGHELNRHHRSVETIVDRIIQSPAVRRNCDPGARYSALSTPPHSPAESLMLDRIAPSPARIDIEITTECQLRCKYCARSKYHSAANVKRMDLETFCSILPQFPFSSELVFVGLGEPLLHPELDKMISLASDTGMKAKLVTNGINAGKELLEKLRDSGLIEVTFSIDSVNPEIFSAQRGGANLNKVLENFRNVPSQLSRSIFTALSSDNVDNLRELVDFVAGEGLPALGLTDLNFDFNRQFSISRTESKDKISDFIRYACERGIVLIGPHLNNVPDVAAMFRQLMVRLPSDLTGRSLHHKNCLSPWRTAVVDVDGNLSPCNCAPEIRFKATEESLMQIWNGNGMQKWREKVMSGSCISCTNCPRY